MKEFLLFFWKLFVLFTSIGGKDKSKSNVGISSSVLNLLVEFCLLPTKDSLFSEFENKKLWVLKLVVCKFEKPVSSSSIFIVLDFLQRKLVLFEFKLSSSEVPCVVLICLNFEDIPLTSTINLSNSFDCSWKHV